MSSCSILVDDHNLCGESPLWDATTQQLYWVDCLASRVFVYDWARKERTLLLEGFEVTGMTLHQDGGFVFINSGGFWRYNGTPILLAAEAEGVKLQLNDCVADARGRVLAGTCFYAPYEESPLGHLVSLDTNGRVSVLDEGFHLANGLGFSPDSRTLYFADSVARILYAYDYDLATGKVSNKRVFVKVDNTSGLPDGLTVDAEGFVWSAEWYGGCIKRYDPDGKLERSIAIPAKQSSSLAFGGPELQDIFVTSAGKPEPTPVMPAGYDASSGYVGGALFHLSSQVRGCREHKANIS
jgi:sugar lactone lactonase YvrE